MYIVSLSSGCLTDRAVYVTQEYLVSIFSEMAFGRASFLVFTPPPPPSPPVLLYLRLKREVKWNSIGWLLPWGP